MLLCALQGAGLSWALGADRSQICPPLRNSQPGGESAMLEGEGNSLMARLIADYGGGGKKIRLEKQLGG